MSSQPAPDLSSGDSQAPTKAFGASRHDGQDALDIRTINEQLLIAGLREQALAEQLQDQLALTTAITTSLGEGICAVDTTGQVIFVNPAAEHLLDWTAAGMLDAYAHTILPLGFAGAVPSSAHSSPLAAVLQNGIVYRNENAIWTRRDGSTFPVAYCVAPIRHDDHHTIGAVVTFRDMTETRRLHQIQDAYTALEVEVRVRTQAEQARQVLLQQLVTVQEEERRRIARELHDQMGQDLTALMFGLKALAGAIPATSPAHERLAQVQGLATRLGQHVRTLAVQLRPAALDGLGLTVALATFIEEWSAQAQVAADIHTTGLDGPRLPLAIETTLYRLVQEALTNVLKHAQATTVSVIIERRQGVVRLIVEDDGVGFDVATAQQTASHERRFGLLGMHERVAQLGGSLTIESTPTSGTTLFVTLPLHDTHREAHNDETPDFSGG